MVWCGFNLKINKMKTFACIFLLIGNFLLCSCSNEEHNENENLGDRNIYIEWENTIGGFTWDILSSIEQTSDGGYIVGGSSNSPIGADKTESSWVTYAQDYWVIKLNNIGEIEWQNSIGGGSEEDMNAGVHQTKDGGFIIGGSSSSDRYGDKLEDCIGSAISTFDYWVVKLDPLGKIQWQNTIGGSGNETIKTILQTSDGGYLLAGDSDSEISGDKNEERFGNNDYWIVKLDASGNIQWQKTIGGNGENKLGHVLEIENGGYMVGGSSNSHVSGNKTVATNGQMDYWIVKLDASGNIQWQISVGGENTDNFHSLTLTSDGNYLLAGNTFSFDNDIMIVKIDPTGKVIWQKVIEGVIPNELSIVKKIINSENNSYVIGGTILTSIYPFQFFDFFALKIDENGNKLNQIILETPGYDELADLEQTSDGGYIIGGQSWSTKSIDKSEDNIGYSDQASDYWVIKISSDF